MQIILWIAVPLMFVLGQWQIIDKVYFAHLALLFLLVIGGLANGASAVFTLPKLLVGWSLSFILSTIFAASSAFNLEALKASTQLLLFILSVLLPCLLVLGERSIVALLYAMLAGASLNAIAGLVQSAIWVKDYGFVLIAEGEWFRVKGTAVSPADYGQLLIVGLALSGLLTNMKFRNLTRLLFLVCLLFSNSRSALIVLVIYGFYQLGIPRLRSVVVTTILIFVIVLVSSMSDAGQLVISRFEDIFNYDFNIKRVITFENVLHRIFAEPEHLLVGHGYGQYVFFHPIDLEDYDNPHNIYLHVLFSGGVLGFVTFFGLIAYLWHAIQNLKRHTNKSPHMARFSRDIEFLFLSVLFIGLVETNIAGIGSGWTAGMCFGCVVASNRVIRRLRQDSMLTCPPPAVPA